MIINYKLANRPSSPFSFYFSSFPPLFSPFSSFRSPLFSPLFLPFPPAIFLPFFPISPSFLPFPFLFSPFFPFSFPFPPLFPPFPPRNPLVLVPEHPLPACPSTEQELFGCFAQAAWQEFRLFPAGATSLLETMKCFGRDRAGCFLLL